MCQRPAVCVWVYACSTTGTVCAKPQGGDTRSLPIEAFGDVILAAVEAQKNDSLVELGNLLAAKHSASFAASLVALPRPPRVVLQKQRTQPSRNGRHRSPPPRIVRCPA